MIKMSIELARMNPGIGPPGTCDFNRFPEDYGQGISQR
jgi:hypothetical protein